MTTFGFHSTTDDVIAGLDLTDQRILVTGASTGLGLETTRVLAAAGASVIMAVRDLPKGAAAAEEVRVHVPAADLELRRVDLADLASVRTFTDDLLHDHASIDVLIANAGIMACPKATTVDGFELQFGTNHLGHFLLITRLMPALIAAGGARVVLLSSAGHRFGDIDLDDPGFDQVPYDPWMAYGRSKTANSLCAVGIDDRFRSQGVRAFAVHPGGIQTELGRHLTSESLQILIDRLAEATVEMPWKTIPQGAATSVWAATSPDLDGQGGVYLEDCHIAQITEDPTARDGVRGYALDRQSADDLWTLSEKLVQ